VGDVSVTAEGISGPKETRNFVLAHPRSTTPAISRSLITSLADGPSSVTVMLEGLGIEEDKVGAIHADSPTRILNHVVAVDSVGLVCSGHPHR
jgi:hypothetical protein